MKSLSIKIESSATSLTNRLKEIDYNVLPISDYNKNYIGNLKPALVFFMKIYATCLQQGLKNISVPLSEIVLVDYGGGSGFLSMLAKEIGIGKVIYIDLNPLSVETIRLLKEKACTGPDVILHGNSDTLNNWCKQNEVNPQLLIATDLIEHVYDLNSFFADLMAINGNMHMVFTTASNPFNPYVTHRLRKMMVKCETGNDISPNFLTLRQQYIQKQFPFLSEEKTKEWSKKTRGLIYDDIKIAIESNKVLILEDKYNTCNPENGNWAERILPISAYQQILKPYGYEVQVKKGFYNTDRKNSLFSFLSKSINLKIKLLGNIGFSLAPFILLNCKKAN